MAKRPPAAQTAFGPMVIVAIEQFAPPAQRLVQDKLAARMLPRSGRLLVGACRWPAFWRFLYTMSLRLSEQQGQGIWGSILCRKRYADDQVSAAIAAGLGQVVILGAGLDTKASRLVAPAGVAAFEVDQPANSTYKQNRLRAIYGQTPDHIALVAANFETDDLAAALAAHGFRIETPTLFVWEAVTQYLTEAGVRRTFDFLAQAASGSRLIVTYVLQDFLDGTRRYGAERLYQANVIKQSLWRFGIAPEHVASLLREYGWAEREQVGRAEYLQRYVAPAGRDLAVSELERFVLAEKI
jgi:methyltransferase (TIGR00027 family)